MENKNKKIIVFNWKMNPKALKKAIILARSSDYKNAVVAPPFLFIEEIGKFLKNAELGAQDLSWEKEGSFTGEISADELKNLKVKYVIVGHSERRQKLGETDEIINKKILSALKAGLKVIFCVGEPLQLMANNKEQMTKVRNYIKKQLEKGLRGINKLFISNPKLLNSNLIIAYEPVWAIGTGHYDTPKDASEKIRFIKKTLAVSHKLSVKVLYGGSVNGKNIKDFIEYKEISGFLVGGASLKPIEIAKIIEYV